MLRLVPMTVTAASRHVAKNHRHNRGVQGGLFACGVEENGQLVGVAIASRPTQYKMDNGTTMEITRVCSNGTANACSKLYGALCRGAAAIGYERVITYTLAEEPGTSLRAAGFTPVATVPAMARTTGHRQRMQVDLFGEERRPPGAKIRWERNLRTKGESNGHQVERTEPA